MEIVQTVRDAAIGVLKKEYPKADVFAEEIPQTVQDNKDSEWFFVALSVSAIINLPPLHREVSLLLTIDYHHPDETNRIYAEAGGKLLDMFYPTLAFIYRDEPRRITVHDPGMNISGHLLHLTVPLQFVVDRDGPVYEPMGELELNMKEE